MLSRLWIFSDLHLTDPQSPLFNSFLKELTKPQSANDAVIFAGDIFDFVVGGSGFFREKFAVFFEQVQELSRRGVSLYYIEGNHDFHLRGLFAFAGTPVKFENEAVILSVNTANGKKMLYIAHGDLVDLSDKKYLALRRFFRSQPLQQVLRHIPGRAVEKIGSALSRSLEDKQQDIPELWPEARRTALRQVFRDFALEKKKQGFDLVVLGHCHDLDAVPPFYWNMGYPPVHRQFLYYDSLEDRMQRLAFS